MSVIPRSGLPTVISTDWDAVQELRSQREREWLRSLSIQESFQHFNELVEFAAMLPQWGDMEKLRQLKVKEVIRWKERIDLLGGKGEK